MNQKIKSIETTIRKKEILKDLFSSNSKKVEKKNI
jgi:hypothetical protein